jgi:signal transduction histidine kinase
MPGAGDAGGEASSLGDWLRCLGRWIGAPLHCHALRLVWVPHALAAPRWVDALEALDASTLDSGEGEGERAAATDNGAGESDGGWLLPLDQGDSGVLCLFCASRADPAQRDAANGQLERAALAARSTWALARPCASEQSEIALVDRRGIRQAIHEFRNGLNSLLMNAATLTYRSDTLPEPLRRFATQMQRDGERCSAALDELEQRVAQPRAHASAPDPGVARQRPS